MVPYEHPEIVVKPPIKEVSKDRTVIFEDDSKVENVDYLLFGTGYVFSLPFLPQLNATNFRIPGAYLHTFYGDDPSLAFVGLVSINGSSTL